MLKIGEFNTLRILRKTSAGIFLGNGKGQDVLLPNRYVTPAMQVGESLTVFIYTDSEDRPVATTETPKVSVGHFAFLEINDAISAGAFADWGLSKDLFIPVNEQKHPLKKGDSAVVFVYLDDISNRVTGSTRISEFLDNRELPLQPNDAVDLMIYEKTDLGYNAIVNDFYKGLIYHNEIFKPIAIGTRTGGYIKKIREDLSIDLSLQPTGMLQLETSAADILDYLKQHNGFLPLTDNSQPEAIYALMQMSKKSFKRGCGILYKQKLIALKDDGIYLL